MLRTLIVVGAIALTVAACQSSSGDDEEGETTVSPAPTQRLTGAEAAALLQSAYNAEWSDIFQKALEPGHIGGLPILVQLTDCHAVDFNQSSRSWIVECTKTSADRYQNIFTEGSLAPGLVVFRFSDETGEYEEI